MNQLALSDILPAKLYEPVRDDMRRKVIEIKKHRRVALGDTVTVVFENRATMIFQVEEMIRAERIDEPAKIQAELDVYNALLPEPGQLSATLFVEITEASSIRPTLHKLVGIDEHVALHIGDIVVPAAFEPGRSEAERISSVQYIRFTLPPAAQSALRTPGTSLALVSSQPGYLHRVGLSDDTRKSLAADLD